MKRWIVIVMVMGLAACKVTGAGPAPTVETTPEATEEYDDWAHVSSDGVTLDVRTPTGWQAIPTDYGILLSEHPELPPAGDSSEGILIFVFVPKLEDIDLSAVDESNLAWSVLDQVSRSSLVSDSTVGDVVGFQWGEHKAAYYLLTDVHGNHTMVLAVALGRGKLVVYNISAPADDTLRMRNVLPVVLSNVRINGVALDGTGLDSLPDTLEFPAHQYHREATGGATLASTQGP